MSEFKDILPLIVDPDAGSKALLRKLLAAFGVTRTMSAAVTDDALMMLRREKFSLVFLDELAGPLKPLHFLKMLRRDQHSADPSVPVVLVSSHIDAAKVTAARDAGMNDVISKPVNLPAIERQLQSVLAPSRAFVVAKNFVGPDRRRMREDRRQFGERPPRFDRRAKKPGTPGAPDPKKPL
ncbi:MAG TPA: response regulator [Rhizomicrobium sp.]|nr:response regulator [Rhizomicrobium sp.]